MNVALCTAHMKTTRFLQLQLKYIYFIILLTGCKLYVNLKLFQEHFTDFTPKVPKKSIYKWKDMNKWILVLDCVAQEVLIKYFLNDAFLYVEYLF